MRGVTLTPGPSRLSCSQAGSRSASGALRRRAFSQPSCSGESLVANLQSGLYQYDVPNSGEAPAFSWAAYLQLSGVLRRVRLYCALRTKRSWRVLFIDSFLVLVMLMSPGCKSKAGYVEVPMNASSTARGRPVEIRIKNASDIDFDRVRVVFPERDEADYGAVAKGRFSAFRDTRHAYRYAQVHVKAGDRDISLEPIDYVGEQELAPGRYTYVLRIEGNRLAIDLEKAE